MTVPFNRIGNGTLWINHGKCRRQGNFTGFDEWADNIRSKKLSDGKNWIAVLLQKPTYRRHRARRKIDQGRMRELQDMRQERAGWQQVQAGLAGLTATQKQWPDHARPLI